MNEDGQGRAPEGAAHSDLRDALRAAIAGLSADQRSAFLDGFSLALELGAEQIIAALEGMDALPLPSGRGRKVAVSASVGDLIEQAVDTLPPRGPKEARALPDHPLGDPEGGWREPSRVLFAVMEDGWQAKDGLDLLRHFDAAELLDLYFSSSEWTIATHPDPAVRAFGWRMAEAGEAILRRETDEAGRAVPLGRLLGLQPPGPGGLSAGQAVALRRRNALIRHARAAHPEWRVASDRAAARAMLEALKRYRAGGWHVDQKDRPPTAPAGDLVRACWWRVCSLGVLIPGTVEGMLAILSE